MAIRLSTISLIWTCLALLMAQAMAKSAADYFVRSLPGQPKDEELLRMHAGHIEVNADHHGNMFFWHFENKHLANRHRTVIWLNGGPGCSSLDGALMEIGPYKLKDSENLVYQPDSWNEFANLLFVDNPVGTGFSYVDSDSYLHELQEMANHFIIFLERYYQLFPEEEGNDIYMAGESYAGQHIPYVAKAIIDRNAKSKGKKWNLKGLLIGNGWISPQDQSLAYLEHVIKAGIVKKDSDIAKQLETQQNICKGDLDRTKDNPHVNYPSCEKILHDILKLTVKNSRCINMYDVRKDDTYPSCGMNWPPDLEFMNPWLRRKDVTEALHVNSDKKTGWVECNGAVGGAFRAKNSKPGRALLPDILKDVPILLFSGAEDLICSHLGTENMIHNMEWNGGKGFETSPGVWAPRQDWTYDGEAAGYYQEARNLTYVLFYNASHMVPWDYPRRTRDMLDRFMGVDIASIGGKPADSRINGEKSSQTSVGGHPNSTIAEQQVEQKIDQERWAAYYKSGSVALVVVAILAVFFGWYVWQDRRRRAGYRGVATEESRTGLMSHRPVTVDPESARAWKLEDNELDDLRHDGRSTGQRYSVGGFSDDDEDEHDAKQLNGRTGAR